MKLELKHLAPYLPYKLKVRMDYTGLDHHTDYIMDEKNFCSSLDGRKIFLIPISARGTQLGRRFVQNNISYVQKPHRLQ